MDVQTKDGILLRNIPDGTPDDVIKARIATIRGERSTPAEKPAMFVPSGEKDLPYAEMIAANPVTRFAAGAGSSFLGLGQGMEEGAKRSPAALGPVAVPILIAQEIRKRLGMPSADETVHGYEELKKRGMEMYGNDALSSAVGLGDTTDVAGMAGAVLSPPALRLMKAPLAKTVTGRVVQGSATGAGFGATTPVSEGDSYAGSKAVQTVTGAILGGLIPGAIDLTKKGYQLARNAVDPWLPGGIERAVGRTANTAAGDKRAAVIDALEKNRQIVPGSQPTAGEAAAPAGSAEFSGLQRVVEGRRPSSYNAMADSQEAARVAAVRNIGGTPSDLAKAVEARGAASKVNYEKALGSEAMKEPADNASVLSISQFVAKNGGLRKSEVAGDLNADYSDLPAGLLAKGLGVRKVQHNGPTAKSPDHMRELLEEAGYGTRSINDMYTMLEAELVAGKKSVFSMNDMDAVAAARSAAAVPEHATLVELAKRPSFQKGVERAREIATEEGINIGDPTKSIKGLHYVKMALDDIVEKASAHESGIGRTQLRAISGTKEKLLKMMDEISPEYKFARETHQTMSKPINRMQVGQELEKALTSPTGTSERPGVFGTAIRNAPQTIKRATGQPRFDSLSEVFNPQEVAAVGNVVKDLQRSAQHDQLARAGGEKARELVGQVAPLVPAAGMFNPRYSVMRAIANRLAGRVEGKSLDRLALAMENPELMADIMRKTAPSERRALVEALLAQKIGRGASIAGAQGAAREEQF